MKAFSDPDRYAMLFGVRRSILYHEERASFFENLHRATGILTILLSGNVFFDISRPGPTPAWMLFVAAIAALLAVTDYTTGFAKSGALHRTLKDKFIDLESDMLGSADLDLIQIQQRRMKIEKDEPGVFRALDVACHNELLAPEGQGKDARFPLAWYMHATRHLLRWSSVAS